jgi:hypothetical protein
MCGKIVRVEPVKSDYLDISEAIRAGRIRPKGAIKAGKPVVIEIPTARKQVGEKK